MATVLKSALAAASFALLLACGMQPAEAQLVHRNSDGTLSINPILCLTDYQVRQAIAARGFSNIFLNAPVEAHIQARATRGRTVYLIDFNRCSGRFVGVRPLRAAR